MPYDAPCKTCFGTGKLDCQKCKRTGLIKVGFLKRVKECDECKGTGSIICRDCEGKGKKQKYIL